MEQETVQNVETTDVVKTENTETQTVEKNEAKTFTQEEVNEMIKTRLRNMPSKEELSAFNEWKESQKTAEEKSLEKDKRIEELTKENTELKNISKVASANVNSTFQKFVLSEVSSMEGDFEENLTNYLKDNPQYLFQSETSKTTGVAQNTTNKKISEEKAYLDKKYAKNPYYKN